MHVLLVEDEHKIADFVTSGFDATGFITHHELDGFRGLNTALIQQFDAIVLDVSLPLMDGFKVLSEIRRHGLTTPVIILTARTELNDRLTAFELGADYYLPKPFFIEELVVRLTTLVHRKAGNLEKIIQHQGLTLDRFSRVATWGSRSATLTQREFVLLECLMLSPGQIFTRQKILKRVWHVDFDPGTNVVDVCMVLKNAKVHYSEAPVMAMHILEILEETRSRFADTKKSFYKPADINPAVLLSFYRSQGILSEYDTLTGEIYSMHGFGLAYPLYTAIDAANNSLVLMARAQARDDVTLAQVQALTEAAAAKVKPLQFTAVNDEQEWPTFQASYKVPTQFGVPRRLLQRVTNQFTWRFEEAMKMDTHSQLIDVVNG